MTNYPNETGTMTRDEGRAIAEALDEGGNTTVYWNDSRLARVTRLRLLTDNGFPMWDVSYCLGMLQDGTLCYVSLPFNQLPKRGAARAIVEYAKRDKVYAKGIGILDAISKLW